MASTSQLDPVELVQQAIHETKKPLSIVVERSQVLPTKGLGKREQKTVELIQDSSERALAFVNAMWEVIKIDSLQPSIESRSVDFVLNEVIRSLPDESLAAVEVESGLPLLEVDTERIVRATSILWSHAVKSASEGKVAIRAYFDNPYVVVSVGEGVSSKRSGSGEVIPNLPKEQAQGTDSIELLLVSRIITLHSGNFWLTKGVGSSVRFNYSLPPVIDRHGGQKTV